MANLTQIELKNIERLIELNKIEYKKINNYKLQCMDSQIKQVFMQYAQENLNTKQKLISFLNA